MNVKANLLKKAKLEKKVRIKWRVEKRQNNLGKYCGVRIRGRI
jgi:hypothetical protein